MSTFSQHPFCFHIIKGLQRNMFPWVVCNLITNQGKKLQRKQCEKNIAMRPTLTSAVKTELQYMTYSGITIGVFRQVVWVTQIPVFPTPTGTLHHVCVDLRISIGFGIHREERSETVSFLFLLLRLG